MVSPDHIEDNPEDFAQISFKTIINLVTIISYIVSYISLIDNNNH